MDYFVDLCVFLVSQPALFFVKGNGGIGFSHASLAMDRLQALGG